MKQFNLGDRVMISDPSMQTDAIFNGIVVKYKGKHYKKESRVRWSSGWATSVSNDLLREMTEDEKRELPLPKLSDIDK